MSCKRSGWVFPFVIVDYIELLDIGLGLNTQGTIVEDERTRRIMRGDLRFGVGVVLVDAVLSPFGESEGEGQCNGHKNA